MPPIALGPLARFLRVWRFFSRINLVGAARDADPFGPPDLARDAWAIPLCGAVLGACAAVIGYGAYALGLTTFVSAALSISALVILTGALHEDGLADCADAMWGGASMAARRAILKDSRIGTYGAAALILSLLLRIAALADLFGMIGPPACWLLIGIAAFSRIGSLLIAALCPPASPEGLGSLAMPKGAQLSLALLLGLAILTASAAFAGRLIMLPAALIAAGLALFGMAALARAKLGGYSGDVFGASQQSIEITLLLGFCVTA